jgi:hypothetical protein
LSEKEIKELFKDPLINHIVIGVKGFFRRANLIPNKWKLRIGATHEFYTKVVDNNVQIQGLSGRMTGYWRNYIESGHKTGPHRTSIQAIQQYEKIFNDPFGPNNYQTSGFKKRKEKISSSVKSMLDPEHISGLNPVNLPKNPCSRPISIIIFDGHINDVKEINLIKDIVITHNPLIYEEYKNYEWHCWNANTPEKQIKWGIARMKEPNAYSSEVNIISKNKKKNILMIYLCTGDINNELILSPWNGMG